jgi:hypothetical protein
MNYIPQIYRIPKNNNIDNFKNSKKLSLNLPFENKPLFILGYHHFIDRTRGSMVITNKLETKNEFYYVVNPFEANIANYEDNINNLSKIYFKNNIESREFYKFWEICFIFDIVDKENMQMLFLNDFGEKQAIEYYRNKFLDKVSKKDKYIIKFNKDLDVDLIISNNNITNENNIIVLLINDIIKILQTQKKKGNCIIKLNDTFTNVTLKLILLLSSLYSESYFYKPFFSRPTESEKFIILKNYEDVDTKKIISNLEEILKLSKNNYITDIFLDIDIPQNLIDLFKFTNIKLVNYQQIMINDIVKYIKDNNYFGDKYHEYRNQQINASEWWVTNFYPPSNNLYKTNKENYSKISKSIIEKNILEKDKFLSILI